MHLEKAFRRRFPQSKWEKVLQKNKGHKKSCEIISSLFGERSKEPSMDEERDDCREATRDEANRKVEAR